MACGWSLLLRPSVWALPKFPLSSALNRSRYGHQQLARDSLPDPAPTHQSQDGKQAEVELAAERLLCPMVDHTGGVVVGRLRDIGIGCVESLGIGSCRIDRQGIHALAILLVGSHDGIRGESKKQKKSKYEAIQRTRPRVPFRDIPLYKPVSPSLSEPGDCQSATHRSPTYETAQITTREIRQVSTPARQRVGVSLADLVPHFPAIGSTRLQPPDPDRHPRRMRLFLRGLTGRCGLISFSYVPGHARQRL